MNLKKDAVIFADESIKCVFAQRVATMCLWKSKVYSQFI